jgi:hypothetical protein
MLSVFMFLMQKLRGNEILIVIGKQGLVFPPRPNFALNVLKVSYEMMKFHGYLCLIIYVCQNLLVARSVLLCFASLPSS